MSDFGFRRARLAANVVIVAVCVAVAQVLWSVLSGRASVLVMPTALKVLTAALWVLAALRFRSAVASLLNPDAGPGPAASGVCPRPTDRAETETRGLEDVMFNETWLIDKADARRGPRDTRDDLEARP